jgi:hypothetical protein
MRRQQGAVDVTRVLTYEVECILREHGDLPLGIWKGG